MRALKFGLFVFMFMLLPVKFSSAAFLLPKNPGEELWKGNDKAGIQENAKNFLGEFGKKLGVDKPDQDLKFIGMKQDKKGKNHLRYNQTYSGVPVFGGQLIVHMKDKHTVSSMNGKTKKIEGFDINAKLDQNEAADQAKKIWSEKEKGAPQVQGTPRLYIYNKKFISDRQKDDQNYLVWQIDLLSPDPYQHKIYFINAQDGTLVDTRDAVKKAVDRRVFNCNDWENNNLCVSGIDPSGADHGRSEGDPVTNIPDIDNLYDYTGSIHNYFFTQFIPARDGANKLGGLGNGSIENPSTKTDSYGRVDNDPYRGYYCPDNAFFEDSGNSGGGATINFCDQMVTKDVVGHEYTHGVSYYSILDAWGDPYGLDYWYESGALEEGDADIFGEAIENYISAPNDWLLAEGTPTGPFRSMSDPGSIVDAGIGDYPARFNSPDFYCGFWDGGGVHHNSTVVSHAAYLMAMGGNYNGCNIGAITRAKEEAIFYQAIEHYFTTTTEFNDAYIALNAACGDLYGAGDCDNVKKALRAVELDQPGACSGLPETTPQCDFSVAPTISKVDADVVAGSYGEGEDMDIEVYFSEPVSSTGNVTVTLNNGASCSFSVDKYPYGWCNYLVGAGEDVNRLAVTSISGTIQDDDGNAMANFTPADNFDSTAIRIDTVYPEIYGVEDGGIYNTDVTPTFNEGTATLNYEPFSSGQTISQEGDYLLEVTDDAGNSTGAAFSIEKVAASITNFAYSARKNNQRIIFTVYNLSLPGHLKRNHFKVRLNGRRVKILSVKNSGGNILINTRQNYRKWAAGDYNFSLHYNYKYNKTSQQGVVNSDYVLTIE